MSLFEPNRAFLPVRTDIVLPLQEQVRLEMEKLRSKLRTDLRPLIEELREVRQESPKPCRAGEAVPEDSPQWESKERGEASAIA